MSRRKIDPVSENNLSHVLYVLNEKSDFYGRVKESKFSSYFPTPLSYMPWRAMLILCGRGFVSKSIKHIRITDKGESESDRLVQKAHEVSIRNAFCERIILHSVYFGSVPDWGERGRWDRESLLKKLRKRSIIINSSWEPLTLAGVKLQRLEWVNALDYLTKKGCVEEVPGYFGRGIELVLTVSGRDLVSSMAGEAGNVSNSHYGDNYNFQGMNGPVAFGGGNSIQNNGTDVESLAGFLAAVRREAPNWPIEPAERAELIRDVTTLAENQGQLEEEDQREIQGKVMRTIAAIAPLATGATAILELGKKIFP